jgi:hypothetical protein
MQNMGLAESTIAAKRVKNEKLKVSQAECVALRLKQSFASLLVFNFITLILSLLGAWQSMRSFFFFH